MSTTQTRITGGDHLVETGSVPVRLVTRGQVSVRMDTRRETSEWSVGKHEWSFGKRGSGLTREVLGALLELGSRAGGAVLGDTVEQGQQVDEEEDVDGHCKFEYV